VNQPSVPELFRLQARYCRILESPLYEHLLEKAAADYERGGLTARVLAPHERDEPKTMLSLRFMGAMHRAVLEGKAPELAEFYPSVGGQVDLVRVWPVFSETLERLGEDLYEEIALPVQTNEVARCAALLGGFLVVAEETGLPLRVLEIGASAGLNLNFDRYGYASDGRSWGDSSSPVQLRGIIEGEAFPWSTGAEVTERRGCDASPLDPTSDRTRLLLRSFIWPDQTERFALLTAALDFARTSAAEVEQADAAVWAARQLEHPAEGRATVMFHSLVMMYLSDESREGMIAAIEAAGEGASDSAPVARLSMELGGDEADVRLKLWPGGEERLIAKAGYQGQHVHWLGSEPKVG
jgi:hypothetical protein